MTANPGRQQGYCHECGRWEILGVVTKLCTRCTLEWPSRRRAA